MKENEFVIEIDNTPGELARICEIIGKNGINLKAITTERFGNQAFVRVLVDKDQKMREVLEKDGVLYTENDVVVKSLDDKPNALTETARTLSKAGVNIESIYLLNKGRDKVNVVFALDNPQRGAEALKA